MKGTIMEWMLMPYRRYADFSGRSCRKEYWMFQLFIVLVAIVLGVILFTGTAASSDGEPGSLLFSLAAIPFGIWVIATIIPSIAVQVRRFHDQDRSGWMILLGFIPYVGGIIVFVFMLLEGTRGANRYGPDPLDPTGIDVFA